MLIASVLWMIGLWTAGYVLLSLSLALIWITLVSIGQSYQSSRPWDRIHHNASRLASLAHNFRRWQPEDDEFLRQLGRLEDSLSGRGERETRASKT